MPDLVLAKKLIADAAQRCVAAAQLADRRAAFDLRRAGEWTSRRAALDDAHGAVKTRLARIATALKKADDLAAAQDHTGADAALDAALKEVDDAAALKVASEQLRLRIDQLGRDVMALTDAAPRASAPHIGADVDVLDADLIYVRVEALKFDIDAATKKFDAATSKLRVAQAKKALFTPGTSGGTVDSRMTALVAQPGGDKLLDGLIAALPPGADANAKVLAALKVRFQLADGAADEGTGAQAAGLSELKRIYRLMTEVPDQHTRDNVRLKQVTRKPAGGSDYTDSAGKINLGAGPASINVPRPLGVPAQLPAVDEDCKPDPTKPVPKHFDWNTQHEIGHALDDRKKFMASRAGDAAFGGWADHGGDVLAVAEAAAAAFNLPGVDKALIAKYLDSGSTPFFAPTGWPTVKAWADRVRAAQNPWDQGAQCTQAASAGGLLLGNRIYHESQPGLWCSYAAAARAQGITGYQFRAPGEWFSELYAAYQTKVLKPAHPARPWLDKLFGAKAGATP